MEKECISERLSNLSEVTQPSKWLSWSELELIPTVPGKHHQHLIKRRANSIVEKLCMRNSSLITKLESWLWTVLSIFTAVTKHHPYPYVHFLSCSFPPEHCSCGEGAQIPLLQPFHFSVITLVIRSYDWESIWLKSIDNFKRSFESGLTSIGWLNLTVMSFKHL